MKRREEMTLRERPRKSTTPGTAQDRTKQGWKQWDKREGKKVGGGEEKAMKNGKSQIGLLFETNLGPGFSYEKGRNPSETNDSLRVEKASHLFQ